MRSRLNHEPSLVTTLVEELLRYEPPVQMGTNRCTVADIDIGSTTIPKGLPLALMLAAANRDPSRFADPDRFDPGRTDNAHLASAASTVSVLRLPAPRRRWRCENWPAGWSIRGSSPTRLHTGPTPSCAAPPPAHRI